MASFNQKLEVSVPASGNTTLTQFEVAGYSRIFVQFTVATNALDAFIISGRSHANSSFVTLYSTPDEYSAPSGLLVGASGDLTTVAAGASGFFIMDVSSLESILIQASASGGTSSVSIYVGGQ